MLVGWLSLNYHPALHYERERAWDIEYGKSELAKSSQCESFIIQNLVTRKSYFE